jgi:hypothetical protein
VFSRMQVRPKVTGFTEKEKVEAFEALEIFQGKGRNTSLGGSYSCHQISCREPTTIGSRRKRTEANLWEHAQESSLKMNNRDTS